jgi:hypothetical protein
MFHFATFAKRKDWMRRENLYFTEVAFVEKLDSVRHPSKENDGNSDDIW